MKILPKGTEITCPQCGRVMCRIIVDLSEGFPIMAKNFESVEALVIQHTPMNCPYDGSPYCSPTYRGGHRLHTKDGWL